MKGKTVVRAPFSGVVEELMQNAGEFVGAGSPIARVVNVDKVTISAEVSEQLLGSLKEGKDGTTISMKFDHLTEPVLSSIHTIGKFIDPVNRTVKIRSEIDKNTILLPNMTGKIAITDVEIADATVIPSTSILKDEMNNDFIYILSTKGADETYELEKVYVKTVSSFNGNSAISSEVDLKGRKVVDAGAKGVSEKDIVKLKVISNE
jgi:multidrug efflux pump subunit AcrA (membrane-fusion protein)